MASASTARRRDRPAGRPSPADAEEGRQSPYTDRAVMQVPKLIRPPTDVTPAEAAAARGRPRPLPDDFLREASTRLGIMSLVAAGLWVAGTILGRLAMRSMPGHESMGLGRTIDDAIAAVSVLASLLVF